MRSASPFLSRPSGRSAPFRSQGGGLTLPLSTALLGKGPPGAGCGAPLPAPCPHLGLCLELSAEVRRGLGGHSNPAQPWLLGEAVLPAELRQEYRHFCFHCSPLHDTGLVFLASVAKKVLDWIRDKILKWKMNSLQTQHRPLTLFFRKMLLPHIFLLRETPTLQTKEVCPPCTLLSPDCCPPRPPLERRRWQMQQSIWGYLYSLASTPGRQGTVLKAELRKSTSMGQIGQDWIITFVSWMQDLDNECSIYRRKQLEWLIDLTT